MKPLATKPLATKPLAISDYTLVTALGDGRAPTVAALRASRSGLAPQVFETAQLETWLGVVPGLDDESLRSHFSGKLASFDCRNNRLAQRGLMADNFGAQVRRAAAIRRERG